MAMGKGTRSMTLYRVTRLADDDGIVEILRVLHARQDRDSAFE